MTRRWPRCRPADWTLLNLKAISAYTAAACRPMAALGIGLERLTMKLCGLSNIRDASLFPRDINHLVP